MDLQTGRSKIKIIKGIERNLIERLKKPLKLLEIENSGCDLAKIRDHLLKFFDSLLQCG